MNRERLVEKIGEQIEGCNKYWLADEILDIMKINNLYSGMTLEEKLEEANCYDTTMSRMITEVLNKLHISYTAKEDNYFKTTKIIIN